MVIRARGLRGVTDPIRSHRQGGVVEVKTWALAKPVRSSASACPSANDATARPFACRTASEKWLKAPTGFEFALEFQVVMLTVTPRYGVSGGREEMNAPAPMATKFEMFSLLATVAPTAASGW